MILETLLYCAEAATENCILSSIGKVENDLLSISPPPNRAGTQKDVCSRPIFESKASEEAERIRK